MRNLSLTLLVALLFSVLAPTPAHACGTERWSVKVGTDADAGLVNLDQSTATTIANIAAFPCTTTCSGTVPANNRVHDPGYNQETTVWVVSATLTKFKLETDEDYHLVLDDGAGHTMIAEIPAPTCATGSPFLSHVVAGTGQTIGITNARAQFDARYTPTSSFQTVSVPVRVMGIGMYDFPHGQTGAATNQMELHPVVDIVFNPSTTPDFSITSVPATLSVARGSSGNATISTAVSGGFNSAISLTVSGAPTGTTATVSPTSIAAPGNGTSTLTLAVGATTAAGNYPITVTGTGGGKTHTASVALTVTAPSTWPKPLACGGSDTAQLGQGASPLATSPERSGSYANNYTATLTGGVAYTISESAPSNFDTYVYLKQGSTVITSNDDISTSNYNSQLSFTPSATGTYTIEATTYAAGTNANVTVSLTSTNCGGTTPDFTLSASPTSTSIAKGSSGAITVSTSVSGGFNAAIALSATGLPSGTSASFSPSSIGAPGSGSSTMTLTVGSSTATGTSTITVTGSGGSKTHSTSLSLTVTSGGATISCGQTVNGSFASTDGISPERSGCYADSFTISLTAGHQVTITLTGPNNLDTYLYVKNASGTIITSNDDISTSNYNSRVVFTPSSSGTYTIECTTYASGVTGTYTLSVTCQ